MKTRNKPAEFINVQTQPVDYTDERAIKVVLKEESTDMQILAIDPDALAMSKAFPNTPVITVYQNGIPTVMSVKQLITDTLISVLGKVEAND